MSDDGLRELAAYVPSLEAPAAEFGHWVPPETTDGVTTMGYYTLSAFGEAFTSDCSRLGFVYPFDWMAWAQTAEGRGLLDDRAILAAATEAQLRQLLTTIIRGDRFSDGTIANAFESGLFLAICRRAGELSAG
jgi:Family of unknown function (DUF6508)